jgi:hypothetical protein
MQVGDLVERPWEQPGRIGLLVARVPRVRQGSESFIVQWSDGRRDAVRSQFLEVISAGR